MKAQIVSQPTPVHLAGPTTDENIQERVSLWHSSKGASEVHVFLGITFEEYAFWVETCSLPASVSERAEVLGMDLPLVSGRMRRSNADFERACRILLKQEQDKLSPDTGLIATLADGVRLAREYSAAMNAPLEPTAVESLKPKDIEHRLQRLGNGAAIACWNGSFDVQRLDSPRNGPIRRVLSSGGAIDAALFDRADERVAYLKSVESWQG